MLQEHAGADGIVSRFVNQNEGASATILCIGVTADRLCQTQVDAGDIVHLQLCRGSIFGQGIDIQTEGDVGNLGFDGACRLTQGVGAGSIERVFRQPADHGLGFLHHLRGSIRMRQHIAARDVDFIGETDRDGLLGDTGCNILATDFHVRDGATLA